MQEGLNYDVDDIYLPHCNPSGAFKILGLQCGSHHSRFLRFPLWVGREILNIIRFVLWLAKKWMFTRKDPLLLTPGASERVPLPPRP